MEDQELPIPIIAPGKVYRRDVADPSHLPQFHQIEGLVIDKDITFGDLKGTLEGTSASRSSAPSARRVFARIISRSPSLPPRRMSAAACAAARTHARRRALPYVQGHGLAGDPFGCGMVDPNVLQMSGIDPEVYSASPSASASSASRA